jgi:hypothetical protein
MIVLNLAAFGPDVGRKQEKTIERENVQVYDAFA